MLDNKINFSNVIIKKQNILDCHAQLKHPLSGNNLQSRKIIPNFYQHQSVWHQPHNCTVKT